MDDGLDSRMMGDWRDYKFTPKPPRFNPLGGKHAAPVGPSNFALGILAGLQGRPMYEGTVPVAQRERNRAANKRARKSRRLNRGH